MQMLCLALYRGRFLLFDSSMLQIFRSSGAKPFSLPVLLSGLRTSVFRLSSVYHSVRNNGNALFSALPRTGCLFDSFSQGDVRSSLALGYAILPFQGEEICQFHFFCATNIPLLWSCEIVYCKLF